ncbi:hypothetical protein ACFOSC_03760 [Streptantibioticus rubrisoli]|uniref:Uncharacterized protein n=1 Tax=Streptantibioticus rubrisoli TaxID=1387313 RepID=A0ABT1PKS6_9ACTN|nr:hypothetical protein [Streptantibioticus rubrisoli]MCQ4045391.1 hypothetical protein [Streptantibioticus rubrisoli]
MHAFEFASALTLGMEGLPVRNRPALEAAGFTGRDLWRYVHRGLDGPLPTTTYPVATIGGAP